MNWQSVIWPAEFSGAASTSGADLYLSEPSARKLTEFFERKGLAALKQEEMREQWYEDWLAYQAEHRLYASMLAPKQFSDLGGQFDLLRYARFLEVFAYFSPGHAYSLQVTFLGFFSIMMGSNEALKKEAVAMLQDGGLFAFGVSEKKHGSDLFGNEFVIRSASAGRFVAHGSKYYIGNANCASMISILARKDDPSSTNHRDTRAPFVLIALRPKDAKGFTNVRKIPTLGVRAAFVGEFDVVAHNFPETDLLAQNRTAWDAVMGTVTLGKFFLGFGSIGICQHAWQEAIAHLKNRILYDKPVIDMPHIRAMTAQACARLMGMKLYAYRALDYVQAASGEDRRYLLYCAVQKAKVSTEGVKVMAQLSQCMGARGFESQDTYFEMALRDIQLIPLLESSAHINLTFAAQFIDRFFNRPRSNLSQPASLILGSAPSTENPYLMEARSNGLASIAFAPFMQAFVPLLGVPNVRIFAKQARAFRFFPRLTRGKRELAEQISLILGQCMSTIAYGQLIAENAAILKVPSEIVSTIFHLLVIDLSECALALAAVPDLGRVSEFLIRRMVVVPRTSDGDWDFVSDHANSPNLAIHPLRR